MLVLTLDLAEVKDLIQNSICFVVDPQPSHDGSLDIVRGVVIAIVLLLFAAFPPKAQSESPKLVVLLVVDQMRADYLDRFQQHWTSGLKRLIDEGAWFRQAAYPYFQTNTCVGHATISTGSLPETHGIIGNNWYDRTEGRLRACADNSDSPLISYDDPVEATLGPDNLMVPTLSDELRVQASARVVSLSMKPRVAVMLAGLGADVALWCFFIDWVTS